MLAFTGMLGLEACRPRPRGQFLAASASASASSRWHRPRVCGLGLEWNEAKAEAQRHYCHNNALILTTTMAQRVLHQYLDAINACGTAESPQEVMGRHSDGVLRPLFSRLLCVPASSAPVERVFSQSGLIVRPKQARMSSSLLESLVFLSASLYVSKRGAY